MNRTMYPTDTRPPPSYSLRETLLASVALVGALLLVVGALTYPLASGIVALLVVAARVAEDPRTLARRAGDIARRSRVALRRGHLPR